MKRSWSICFAVLLPLLVAGCGSTGDSGGTFDNTGGPPPPGVPIAFRSVSLSLDGGCLAALGAALAILARAATDIPVINGNASCTDSLRTVLADTFAALTSDQAVGIYNVNLGGCVRSYEIALVNRDGLVIRPWVLLHDAVLGASSGAACTADAILNIAAFVFDGAAGANAMELHLGTINPNYPRNPDVPTFACTAVNCP